MKISSIPLCTAWFSTRRAGYSLQRLRGDLTAGLTVGIIAIPLAMALAIAVGVAPQQGLYTVLIAAPLIAFFGGSRFNVSGPTAAFVVILLPIVQQYGLGGLLLCTMLAGLILIAMGLCRIGRLIQFVPFPVTLGFTAGIGVVIATLQVKDLFGLTPQGKAESYIDQLGLIISAFPGLQPADTLVGLVTLAVLIIWPGLVSRVPSHLAALTVGTLLGLLLSTLNLAPTVLGDRFSYLVDGVSHPGIPPFLPDFFWPWQLPGPDGHPLTLDFALLQQLLAPACAIAMLGAIESLLCAVVADGVTDTRHDPNAELCAQGIGNFIAPLFGGVTATAAIARTAVNIRSGAFSPLASMVHAMVVLLSILLLAPVFRYLPMAALAAMLVMVAWNMSEPRHLIHALRTAPRSDIGVLLICLILTVLFDMVLAVGVGMLMAAGLFIKRMSDETDTASVPRHKREHIGELPPEVQVFAIRGALFFGAADKALSALRNFNPDIRVVIIDMTAVPLMDMTALSILENIVAEYQRQGKGLILSSTSSKIRLMLRHAGIMRQKKRLAYVRNLHQAREMALHWLDEDARDANAKDPIQP